VEQKSVELRAVARRMREELTWVVNNLLGADVQGGKKRLYTHTHIYRTRRFRKLRVEDCFLVRAAPAYIIQNSYYYCTICTLWVGLVELVTSRHLSRAICISKHTQC
jgi:hypothetical protein